MHFDTPNDLDQHRTDSEKHSVCRLCQPTTDFYVDFALRWHLTEIHNACSKCQARFPTTMQLEDHSVHHHNMCRRCWQSFRSTRRLRDVSLLPLQTSSFKALA